MKTIGVLALQGAFAKHCAMLSSLGANTIEVRTKLELAQCDALIIPGGESTTMSMQLAREGLFEAVLAFATSRPIFGTCAGLILMAKELSGPCDFPTLKLLDITVQRNAYGRQVNSFSSENSFNKESFSAVFIRAPQIISGGPEVKVLARHQGQPILVQQGHHLGATFHPELSESPTIHQYFIEQLLELTSI